MRVLLPRGFCSIGEHRWEIIEGQLRGADVITSRRIKSCLSYNRLFAISTVQSLCRQSNVTSNISRPCVSLRIRKFYFFFLFFYFPPLTSQPHRVKHEYYPSNWSIAWNTLKNNLRTIFLFVFILKKMEHLIPNSLENIICQRLNIIINR